MHGTAKSTSKVKKIEDTLLGHYIAYSCSSLLLLTSEMPMPFLEFDDHALFPCLNVVIVGYALLLFAPKWKHTPSVTLFIVFAYSLMYTLLLGHRLFISEVAMPEAKFDSLDAVILLFADNAVLMVTIID
jgi:hypothetical protein